MRRRDVIAGLGAFAALGACAPAIRPEEIAEEYPPIGDFVEVEGRRIHYWEQGAGRPVVLIHGASGNLRDWTFSPALRLAERHRVIAFDRPGFGYSERGPADAADPATQARILAAAAREIGAERPIVVGHSLGGAVALAWGLNHPDQTAGLVPVSAAAEPSGEDPSIAEALGLDGLLVSAYTAYAQATAGNGGVDRFVARAFRPQDPPPGYADYVGAPLALREATLRANAEDIQALNPALRRMAPRYGRLDMPVEVLHGERDWLLPPRRHAMPLAAAAPRATLTIAEGIGHMAHHAATDDLVAAVDRVAAASA